MNRKDIIVYGTGKNYYIYKDIIENFNVVAFIDSDAKKHGCLFDGKKIIAPEDYREYAFDYILLCSVYQVEMYNCLSEMGVDKSKILPLQEWGRWQLADNYSMLSQSSKEVCIILSNAGRLGGTFAVLNMAKVLLSEGYKCRLITIHAAVEQKSFEDAGIEIIEEHFLSINNQYLVDFLARQDCVFVNDLYFRDFLVDISRVLPNIVFWNHGMEGCSTWDFEPYRHNILKNITAYGVGKLACDVYRSKFNGGVIKELLYMVDNSMAVNRKKDILPNMPIVFAIVGVINTLKGHDVLIDAIAFLSESIRKKCVFKVIGAEDERIIANKLRDAAENLPELEFCGCKTQNELRDIYGQIDVMISASRADTMPTVLVEGMLNKIPCITSSNTGIAYVIEDGKSGIVFENENALDLAKKITWYVKNKDRIPYMGECAYGIYEKYFSVDVFRQNVIAILKRITNAD